jgi:hypothetical protein
MHPTKRYVDGLKAHAHARIDGLKLGDLVAAQRHMDVDRFMLTRGGHLRCPECLPHGLTSSLEPWAKDSTQPVCPLCGFKADRPNMAERTR